MDLSATAAGEAFEPPFGSLHPDWAQDWGQTIKAPRNRKAILDNRRLAHRPAADLARQLDVPALTGSTQDIAVFKALSQDPTRFVRVVGLASQAHYLASLIQGETLRKLSAQFPVDDLKIAIACRAHVAADDHTGLDLEGLGVEVRDAGPSLVLGWAETCHPSIRGRVRLMLPKGLSGPERQTFQPIVNHNPGNIVRRVAELVSPPGPREKPHHDRSW